MEVRTQFEVLRALNIVDVKEAKYVNDILNNIEHPIVLLNVEYEGSFKNYKGAHRNGNNNT